MDVVPAISGWIAAILTAIISLPQAIRLAKTGSATDVVLLPWQATLFATLAWSIHGIATGQPALTVPNSISAVLSTLVVIRAARLSDRNVPAALAVPVALTAAAFLVQYLIGDAAFGAFILVPSLIGWLLQIREIFDSGWPPGLSVSGLWLIALCQGAWLGYSVPRGETAITTSVAPLGLVVLATIAAKAWSDPSRQRMRLVDQEAPQLGMAFGAKPGLDAGDAERPGRGTGGVEDRGADAPAALDDQSRIEREPRTPR